jgi:hypothetical protein
MAALIDDQDSMLHLMELLEGLSQGEQAVLDGRTLTQREARENMSKWLR